MNENEALLSDIRVLDLSDEMGVYCAKLMADLGADVLRIEPPGGHPMRNLGPFVHDEPDPEKSLYWFQFNTSKRGITLNLDNADGRDLDHNSDVPMGTGGRAMGRGGTAILGGHCGRGRGISRLAGQNGDERVLDPFPAGSGTRRRLAACVAGKDCLGANERGRRDQGADRVADEVRGTQRSGKDNF